MVSQVFVSLFIVGFCSVSTQDVISVLSVVHEDNITETIGTQETMQNSTPKLAITKAIRTSVRKEKESTKSKVEKTVSPNQTYGLAFSELSSILKDVTSSPQDTTINLGLEKGRSDGVNLTRGHKRPSDNVSLKEVSKEATSRGLVTSGKGVVGRGSNLDWKQILNTAKESITERTPNNLRNVSGKVKVSSENLDFKLHTKELKEFSSPYGSDLITVHTEFRKKSSAAAEVVADQKILKSVTVGQVEKETTLQPDVEKSDHKQKQLDFNHLSDNKSFEESLKDETLSPKGSQKGAAHKEEEIGLEKKETEKIKDKRTTIVPDLTSVRSGDEISESTKMVLGKSEYLFHQHPSDMDLQETNALNESREEHLFVEWMAKEQKPPDLKLDLGSNITGNMFTGLRDHPRNDSEHSHKNVDLESNEGEKAFADNKEIEADSSGSGEIYSKIVDFDEPLDGVTLDHASKDPHGVFHRTLEILYKPVTKTKDERRRIGPNFLDSDTFGQMTKISSENPVLKVSEFGSESIEQEGPRTASVLAADVTDRLKSAEGEPKGIEQSQSSIGGEHLDRGSKHGGDPSSHSSIHTSTHPSRTESDPNDDKEVEDILVIEARRGHKKTDFVGMTMIDRVIENKIPIDGRGPAGFPEPTGDSALKVAKGGSEDSSNDDSGATGIQEGGKVEVVKAAAGHEKYAEELSKWGSVSWAFASGFVTSLLATGLCYLVVKSRRTSTYRIREIAV